MVGVAGTQQRRLVVRDFHQSNAVVASRRLLTVTALAADGGGGSDDVGMVTNPLLGDDVTRSTRRRFVRF